MGAVVDHLVASFAELARDVFLEFEPRMVRCNVYPHANMIPVTNRPKTRARGPAGLRRFHRSPADAENTRPRASR